MFGFVCNVIINKIIQIQMTASIGCCKIIGTIEYSAYFAAKKPLKDFWTFKEQICEDFCLIMLKYFDIESIFYRKTSALNKKYSLLKSHVTAIDVDL